FRAGEAVEAVRMETKNFQYLYHDGTGYVFMDKETYDQMSVDQKVVGPSAQFLREGESVEILFNGDDIISLEIPITVELKVVETPPGVRGVTATGAQKPAKVETGAPVYVPLFLNEGDRIKVDTRTGSYIERVKAA
ncbi:MAG: elongation factor P, partial [Ignavibacteria bacterium 13_1_40CM_2_61_4]